MEVDHPPAKVRGQLLRRRLFARGHDAVQPILALAATGE